MSSPFVVVDKIVEYIVGIVFQSVGRHVGFLLHYKQNLRSLEEEMNNLQGQNTVVEGKVNQAKHCGEAVDNDVLLWQKDVDETRQGVNKFMDEKTVKENMLCFNFSCPNFISRYRLSKQAEKKVVRIKHLVESSSKIGTVSHPRENPPELELPSSKAYEDFHSRQKVFKDIVRALKDPEVNMIGVYGTGGIGKTTMVEKVGKLLKEDGTFDEVVMAVVSQDANVIKVQGQLADYLKEKLSGETEVGRANQLWNRLDNGKKNLIILDDVWQELDLKKIGIPVKDGNKRCKVVLTSQNRDVWKNMDVHDDFHVEFLSEKEAWTLFKKKVGNHVDSHDQPLRDIAWAVCKECQGLPVAINAIGAALKGKDMHAWKDALHKLKSSMLNYIEGIDPKVYTSLKWSYDRLESEDAKSCFLLCCLFAEDAEIFIDDLVRYYIAWRTLHRYQMPDTLETALDRVCTVVGTLKSCCLLLDGRREHFVKMHDVVRDVAISIAEDEKSFLVKHGFKDWPEKAAYEHCSVISFRPDNVHNFPNELDCSELHTLRLDCTINGSTLQVPGEIFSGMGKLMVLDLERVFMSPLLPASLAKLAKLQMLCLNDCDLGDITILKNLKDHLEILSLRGSNIKVLPPEVGELTHLRLLDMRDCDELGMISKGVISNLFRLEELYMPMSFCEWEGRTDGRETSSVSLDELMSLTQLTTLHIWIPDVALLPKGLTFANHVRFRILFGEQSNYGYDLYSRHEFLEYTRWKSQGRPGHLTEMEGFWSTGVVRLKNIHVANTLEFLLGKPKWSIQRNGLYPSIFINHLTDLYVRDCGLKYLFSPSCAKGLVRLQCLGIQHCGVMEGVIGIEGDKDEDIPIIFSGLKLLYLENLPNLISFYPQKEKTATSSIGSSSGHAQRVLFNDKATFPALKSLEIDTVNMITEIWHKQMLPIPEIATESSFCELSDMKIRDCNELMNVVGGCPKLETIAMEKGKEVDDYHVTRFPKLQIMQLVRLQNLESFCSRSIRCEVLPLFDHQATFPALKSLEIGYVNKITEIWHKQMLPISEIATESSFCELSDMKIHDCDELMNVIGGCPKLETIAMEKGKGKEVDDYHVTRFPKLKILLLRSLRNFESFCSRSVRCEVLPLFDHQVAFPALERLEINILPITDIWDKKLRPAESFCLLRDLCVDFCDKLVNVVQSNMLPQLRNLKNLSLCYCQMMEVIVDLEIKEEELQEATNNSIIPFPELTMTYLFGMQNIKSFCIFRSGEQPVFNAQECPLLANLFTASVAKALGGLKVLYLSSCSTMEEVITTDEEGHKDVIDDDDEIVFPKLERLILEDLPNLKSFCSSNHNLNFPSLRRVVLKRCPKVQTFMSRSVCMPKIILTTSGSDGLVIEDLNKQLEQQQLKGDQEIIWGSEEVRGDEDQRYYYLERIIWGG